MRIFNSLTRKVEDFVPMRPPRVAMYTCGPTVYSYPTIGNWRTYVLSDLVFRVLTYMGLRVEYVMNLTDVGHLTSDADTGEDKLQKKAVREGKTAWEVAKFYGDDFVESFAKLNLSKPKLFSKATDHIKEQIELIGEIEKAGFVYKINDGVYFDVAAYEKAGNVYGELSNLEEIKAGARVEVNPEKKDSRDFALWKFSPSEYKRDMEWDSPWGRGFPGWHIECSAMSMKYLGKQLDIHLGGEDLLGTHHPNEIAQSEAATARKPFCKYWVHGAFLIVDGGKMGKSKGNAFTLNDIEAGGFDPLALRYFYLTGHYRKQLNFTWEALAAAGAALSKLRQFAAAFREQKGRTQPRGGTRDLRLSPEKLTQIDEFKKSFCDAVEDDLNMPEALAVVWEMVKSNIPDYDKYELLVKFDEILGFSLSDFWGERLEVSGKAEELLRKRGELRAEKRFAEADQIREELNQMGYAIRDEEGGAVLTKI